MRVLLRGTFSPYSGYGIDTIGLASALDRQKDVEWFPAPVQSGSTAVTGPLPKEVADGFTRDPRGSYDLTVSLLPPFMLSVSQNVRESTRKVVGWSMWNSRSSARRCSRGSSRVGTRGGRWTT